MSTTDTGQIAVLVTGLFKDAETVTAAIESSQQNLNCKKLHLHPENMIADNWDDAVKLVLSVSKVITV